MKTRTFLAHLRRETRGGRGRLSFFVACLAVGVAAVVSVAGFSAGLDRGIRQEARKLLAADLAIQARRPLTPKLRATVEALPGAESMDILEMLTLAALPGTEGEPNPSSATPSPGRRSQLVELKAVGDAYPFYGDLRLSPDRPLSELLTAETALADEGLLTRLGIEVGGTLRVGGQDFQVAGTILDEPDRIAGAFSMGPRLLLSHAGLARSGLEQFGSTILYRTLLRIPPQQPAELEALAEDLRAQLPDDGRYRLETYRQAQPGLRQGIERMDRYLGLAALLSLLIGGVGVAQTVRAWLSGRLRSIAVLKCLGYRPREVLWLYLAQTLLLGLVGSLVGAFAGVGLQMLAARLLEGLLPVELINPWQPMALLRGLGLGLGVALLFSLPTLLEARRVPPVRVLRQGAAPLPLSRMVRAGLAASLLLGVGLLSSLQSGSLLLGGLFTAGLVVATLLLGAGAWALTLLSHRPRRSAPIWLRHGLAALGRPGSSTLGAIIALGLGVLIVLAMHLVERGLTRQLARDLPAEAPTAFLVDIQPDQWEGVERSLGEQGGTAINSVPVVMARLAAIDGEPVADLAERLGTEDGEGRWALRREQRLTYLERLPPDNTLIAGSLWSDPERFEISVEKDFAESLGLALGSLVRLDIQGVPLELIVSSVRKVDWQSFGINFYLVVEPGALDGAPQSRIAAARLPRGEEGRIQDHLAGLYPNVTLVQIREVLEKISAVLRRLASGVRLLGSLTVLAGLAILAGSVSAGASRRGAEVALLKTLGMTRRQVMATLATEYALVGLVSALIGLAGGTLLAWAVLTRGMLVPWQLEPWQLLGALAITLLLSTLAGLAASLRALAARPVEVLRRQES